MEQSWFTTRIGTSISRTIPKDGTRDVLIKDAQWAEHLYKNLAHKHTYAEL